MLSPWIAAGGYSARQEPRQGRDRGGGTAHRPHTQLIRRPVRLDPKRLTAIRNKILIVGLVAHETDSGILEEREVGCRIPESHQDGRISSKSRGELVLLPRAP